MGNILVDIDKKYGTEYSAQIQAGSFMGFVQYIERQLAAEYDVFVHLKNRFDSIKSGDYTNEVNKSSIVKFIRSESTDVIADVLEYAVNFFTTSYKLSDFDEIKDKLIALSEKINEIASYRHDNYQEFLSYLKVVE